MKKISFIDEENQKLVQYQCKNIDKAKYKEFINFLYRMKLLSKQIYVYQYYCLIIPQLFSIL